VNRAIACPREFATLKSLILKCEKGEFEGGFAKDPKTENTEILLSLPRGGWENQEKMSKNWTIFLLNFNRQ
jgi:hypothetical protein